MRLALLAALSALITFTTGTVTGTAATGDTAARANSYDDAWQNGASGWVANAKAILAGGTGQVPGMVLWIGDSLTRDPALGAWAQRGAGKTADRQVDRDANRTFTWEGITHHGNLYTNKS